MNPIDEALLTGTFGELLVQLRLFQYQVQATPPLKDTGNDLIAVRGETLKAIQVKTTRLNDMVRIPTDRLYHALAIVRLSGEGRELHLDQSEIYLIDRSEIDSGSVDWHDLERFRLCQGVVDSLFPPP